MAKRWSEDSALVDAISGNLYQALPLLPKRLVRLEAISHEFGMPFSHIQILCTLSEQQLSIGNLSAKLGIAKPNITPLVESLRERGLLERCRSEQDRRIVYVRLTQEGQEVAQRVRQSIAEQVMAWPACLSGSDAKRLNNALAHIIEVARLLAQCEAKPFV